MDNNWKAIIMRDERYNDFTLLNLPEKFCELFAGQDIPYVQVHSLQVYDAGGEQYIVGFCGAFGWKDGQITSIDGDSYSENTLVYGFHWFTDAEGGKCLDILVGEEW